MLRKGYIDRQLEALVRTLLQLKKWEEEDRKTEAVEGLRKASRELTGIPWNLVQTMTAESLLGLMQSGPRLDVGKCAVVAVLLYENGMREEEANRPSKARNDYLKSLYLLETAMRDEPLLNTESFLVRVQDLRKRLGIPLEIGQSPAADAGRA